MENDTCPLFLGLILFISKDPYSARTLFTIPFEDEILFDDKMENDPVVMTVSKEKNLFYDG